MRGKLEERRFEPAGDEKNSFRRDSKTQKGPLYCHIPEINYVIRWSLYCDESDCINYGHLYGIESISKFCNEPIYKISPMTGCS